MSNPKCQQLFIHVVLSLLCCHIYMYFWVASSWFVNICIFFIKFLNAVMYFFFPVKFNMWGEFQEAEQTVHLESNPDLEYYHFNLILHFLAVWCCNSMQSGAFHNAMHCWQSLKRCRWLCGQLWIVYWSTVYLIHPLYTQDVLTVSAWTGTQGRIFPDRTVFGVSVWSVRQQWL